MYGWGASLGAVVQFKICVTSCGVDVVVEFLWRVVSVFAWTAGGLFVARFLSARAWLFVGLSRRLGVPGGLFVVGLGEARAAHAALAQLLRRGEVDFRHVLKFSFVTWPVRVVFLHLRLGVVPVAVGSLGLLGVAYLSLVYLPSLVGMAIGLWLGRGLRWPEADAAAARLSAPSIFRTALSVAGRYAVFETVFLALDLWNVKIRLDWLPLSPEAVAAASLAAVRPTLGIMAAAPPYWGGRVSAGEVLAALLLGRLVYMALQEFPRATVQFYGSIYPPAVAGRLVLYTAAVLFAVFLPAASLLLWLAATKSL